MGLEYEDEIRQIRKENIQNAIAKKEVAALDALDLNALRSLDDEDEIPEPQEGAGQAAESAVPGESSSAGMPDLSMPGANLPPLPNMPAGPPPQPANSGPPPAPPAPPMG
jgi:hypothetical protein